MMQRPVAKGKIRQDEKKEEWSRPVATSKMRPELSKEE